MANGHLILLIALNIKGLNTKSWVLGLILYRNNNLNNIIGILSDLYSIIIKYVDKIINPFNGNFCYKNRYYNIIYSYPSTQGFGDMGKIYKLYTWTSKIMDPSERYTPCLEIVLIGDYMINQIHCPFSTFNISRNLIIYYKSKPRSPIFDSLFFYAKYSKSVLLKDKFKIGWYRPVINFILDLYNPTNKYKFKLINLPALVKSGLLKCNTFGFSLACMEQVRVKYLLAPVQRMEANLENQLSINCNPKSLKEITVSYLGNGVTKTYETDEGKIELEILLKLNKISHTSGMGYLKNPSSWGVCSKKVKYSENRYLNSERIKSLYFKRVINSDNYLHNKIPEFTAVDFKNNKGNNNKVKRKITEKNKTKSRSNKWKYIISEKSRKHIILGCEGKTYFEKLENFYSSWWNYYIIRKCNTGEILYEYHSPIQDRIRILHYKFRPPYKELPEKINKFLNYSEKFRSYCLEKRIAIVNDNVIDQCTELYLYFNNVLRIKKIRTTPWPEAMPRAMVSLANTETMYEGQESDVNYFKLDSFTDNEPEFTESNIEQYYSFCNNKNVYVGWVSIIKINNYSAQPTYYNNLIKRYRKEWINMLKYWVDVPNNNLKWNSNTKMSDTNILAIATNQRALSSPIKGDIRQNNEYTSLKKIEANNEVKVEDNLRLSSNSSSDRYLSDPFIPNKYQHLFNYLKIRIKNIKSNNDLYHKYTKSIKKKNKLPWGIKESIMEDVEKNSREFIRVRPKYK